MTVDELFTRFPEIPSDLYGEPLVAKFAQVFDGLLQVAQKPSACAEEHNSSNHYYLKLVGPMDIYRYGLYTRERVLEEIQAHLSAYRADPERFADTLVPEQDAPGASL